MLRGLVLAFLLLNAALFFWIRSDPPQLRPDREPQRLDRQISPEAVQVLPDLPTSSPEAGGGGGAAAVDVEAASAPSAGASHAAGAGSEVASTVADADLDCAESAPLGDNDLAALRRTLAKAGVPPGAIVERRQPAPTWLVYMGRFSDPQALQAKADELTRLNLKFTRVTQPAALSPGLSLGSFASAPDATERLEEFGKHGVKTARVVQGVDTRMARLQVRSASPGWRLATGAQHFEACPAQPA